MEVSSEPGRARRAIGTVALILGGAVAFVAARTPVAWGMILGSGVELGGAAGQTWLQNLTEASVAVGVIMGGQLVDRGKLTVSVGAGAAAIALGALISWRATDSAGAVLVGLGLLASVGAGLLMATAVVAVAAIPSRVRGLLLGASLCLGVIGVQLSWGSASMFSLARGADWVLGQTAWIGPSCALIGGALILAAGRLGVVGTGTSSSRLPLLGPPATDREGRFSESPPFMVLVGLALVAAFVGLAAQRAGAALSLIGLPDESFASGVLVGYTFALARAGGAAAGGVLGDLLGPRFAVIVTLAVLAATVGLLSFFTGYENPWHPLIGSVGVASGMGFALAPLAGVHLLGRKNLGYHFGFLYLAVAVGNVLVLPLQGSIESDPQMMLRLFAALCLALAVAAARWLRPPVSAGAER